MASRLFAVAVVPDKVVSRNAVVEQADPVSAAHLKEVEEYSRK